MKRQLIFALIAGSHRHRYTDTSGRCAACHRMHSPHKYEEGTCTVCGFAGCDHPKGCKDNGNWTHVCPVCGAVNSHVWYADPTETRCKSCELCEAEMPHRWQYEEGYCYNCNYRCTHPSFTGFNDTEHKCSICGMPFPHGELTFLHEDYHCQSCSICHATFEHNFANKNESSCGACSKCGDKHNSHQWAITGICSWCHYKCMHPTVVNNECTTCGFNFTKTDAAYDVIYYSHTSAGIYAGSYVYKGLVNQQSYFRQYVWQGKRDSGNWVEGQYYMVHLNISTPTQFGGNYAYTATGFVFVTTLDNFPINDTLLSGNGKYKVTLEQYELDGTFKAKSSYTSSDCLNMYIQGVPGGKRW